MSSVHELKSRLSRLSPDEFRQLQRWMAAQTPGVAPAPAPGLTEASDLQSTRDRLGEERARFQHLFEHSPVATWLEDWTALGQWLEHLRGQGVEDLSVFLSQHPEQVRHALTLIRVRDVNQAAVEQNAAR
ncbi:MAG TPA: hypothetical protein VNZ22_00720, partial [Bacillota bacterium]|nr:hypothetical protein [Bacillota bacterium]